MKYHMLLILILSFIALSMQMNIERTMHGLKFSTKPEHEKGDKPKKQKPTISEKHQLNINEIKGLSSEETTESSQLEIYLKKFNKLTKKQKKALDKRRKSFEFFVLEQKLKSGCSIPNKQKQIKKAGKSDKPENKKPEEIKPEGEKKP